MAKIMDAYDIEFDLRMKNQKGCKMTAEKLKLEVLTGKSIRHISYPDQYFCILSQSNYGVNTVRDSLSYKTLAEYWAFL